MKILGCDNVGSVFVFGRKWILWILLVTFLGLRICGSDEVPERKAAAVTADMLCVRAKLGCVIGIEEWTKELKNLYRKLKNFLQEAEQIVPEAN